MKKIVLVVLIFCLFSLTCFSLENQQESTDVHKNAVKFTFLSWFSGSTKISYERAFQELKQSGELCLGLISAGYDKYQNQPRGFTVRYGHKFFLGNFEKAKPFDGLFLRPEVIYSHFSYNQKENSEKRDLAKMCAILGTVGYQKTFGRLIVDSWVGAGYAFGKPCDTGYHHGFQLWNWFNTKNENLALSFSIRLGWCF